MWRHGPCRCGGSSGSRGLAAGVSVDVEYGQPSRPPPCRVDDANGDGGVVTVGPRPRATHHHHDRDAHPGRSSVAASGAPTIYSEPGAASDTATGGVTARGSDFADLMRLVKAAGLLDRRLLRSEDRRDRRAAGGRLGGFHHDRRFVVSIAPRRSRGPPSRRAPSCRYSPVSRGACWCGEHAVHAAQPTPPASRATPSTVPNMTPGHPDRQQAVSRRPSAATKRCGCWRCEDDRRHDVAIPSTGSMVTASRGA